MALTTVALLAVAAARQQRHGDGVSGASGSVDEKRRLVLAEPPVPDFNIQNLLAMQTSLATVAVAQNIGLFEFLRDASFTVESVARDSRMSLRASEAMIVVLTSLGLVAAHDDGMFTLTDEAKTYLIKDSPFYRKGLLSLSLIHI